MEYENKLRVFLEEEFKISIDDDEMDKIIQLAREQDGYEHNKGVFFRRTETNPREKAFYEEWLKENRPLGWVNNGHGILQDLFIESKDLMGFERKTLEVITNRDRKIVATVVQWLGSNCGMAFLHEALRKFNARIVFDEPK